MVQGCFPPWPRERVHWRPRPFLRGRVRDPGSDAPSRLQRALSSQKAQGLERAAGGLGSSTDRCCLLHTGETTSLKMQIRESREHWAVSGLCVQVVFPVRHGSGAPGSLLQTLTRLHQLLLCSFILVYISLICQVFCFLFFFVFKKT